MLNCWLILLTQYFDQIDAIELIKIATIIIVKCGKLQACKVLILFSSENKLQILWNKIFCQQDNLSAQFSHMMMVRQASGDTRDAHAVVYPSPVSLQTPAPHQAGYMMPSPGQNVPTFPSSHATSVNQQQSFIQQQVRDTIRASNVNTCVLSLYKHFLHLTSCLTYHICHKNGTKMQVCTELFLHV